MSNDQTPNWQPEKNAELCAEISGFLFQHPCGMFARYRCHQCEKPICVAHSVALGERPICESCAESPIDQQKSDLTKHWQDKEFWDNIDVQVDDRPMWYRRKGGIHKPSSSTPIISPNILNNDFTDADEIGFNDNGPGEIFAEQPWENDMGAS